MNLVGDRYLTRYEPTHQPRRRSGRLHRDRHRCQAADSAAASPRHLRRAGARVVGVARGGAQLDTLRGELPDFIAVTADAADPATAGRLIDEYQPRTVVLCAGAAPQMSPLQEQTWESFSQNWNVDVAQAFHWIRHALRRPLAPGSTVIAVSSGAAINGSPLSGGYAGAKATVRFITGYAAHRVGTGRAGNRLRLGAAHVDARDRARREGGGGVRRAARRRRRHVRPVHCGPRSPPEQVGKSVLEIATGERRDHRAYTLSSAGLSPLG